MQTSLRSSLPIALVLALAGCDVLDPIITTGFTSETGPWETSTVTTDDPSAGSASDTTSDTTSDGASTTTVTTADPTNAFIFPADPPAQCDVWAQDCPAGEKCAAEGPKPLNSGSITCTPIAPDPDQLGEPCQLLVEGHLGPDTCDIGLYCYDVDPVTQQGTCASLCTGSPDNPSCGAGQVCLNTNLPMCLTACDPLLGGCAGDDLCLMLSTGFGCWPDDSQPQHGLFEGCEYLDTCDNGLFCGNSEGASECDLDSAGCCLAYCDVNAPNTCPGVGQQCLPFFSPGDAPPGYEHLGACFLP
ncbi:hypothetical protein [Nannocystis punicea]|uniref:Lipoprotein n=1 Tax=Nannocystis punicea TaxID=2995304 RepID=A0ABY7H3X4_9BACT|nr:hypothetical protein [Nannocystis poenicansa]WAS93684.1 hypothetical protein O0S08_46725 [Nannocystis poenicansa]